MDPKEEIRQRVDVAELIGEYLELKKAGSGSFKAVCPFHSEKTPSFHVSKEKQIWHCFGCGLGGDIFAFLMQMEGLDFPEALRLLGKRAGVEIPRYDSTQTNERSRVVDANTLAQKFFAKVLWETSAGDEVRSYLDRRGISRELAEEFGLGFALDRWDALTAALGKRGYSDSELVAAGLALSRKQGGGVIDRFRSRLMIPLADAHGNIVAFTGRVLPSASADAGPKYMNSPETSAYRKGEILYGLSKAKQTIKSEQAVIIVEGNLDVIASHKAGVKNVVGSSGTALTDAQIRMLQRYTNTLVFCFDKDAAGFAAAQRGMRLATKMGGDVRVLLIPEDAGKDPDEVVQKDSNLWREIVAHPIPIMEYLFAHATRGKDLQDVTVKREVGNFLLGEVAILADAIEQEHWLGKLADLLRMDIHILREAMKTKRASGDGARGVSSKVSTQTEKVEIISRAEKALEVILSLFLQLPQVREDIVNALVEADLPAHPLSALYVKMKNAYTLIKQNSGTQEPLYAAIERESATDPRQLWLLATVAARGEDSASQIAIDDVPRYLQEHLAVLQGALHKERRQEWQKDLRAAEARGDQEAVQLLLTKLQS